MVDDITAAREEAKRKQKEADRKLLRQRAEFDRRAKEAEMKAEEERLKLKAEMDKMSNGQRPTRSFGTWKKLRWRPPNIAERSRHAFRNSSRKHERRKKRLTKSIGICFAPCAIR